jgi:transcriptional regulator with XRE-family HTH domain
MEVNEAIRARRVELGLSVLELATKADLSVAEYDDIEDYADEATTVAHVRKLKLICQLLGLQLLELLGVPCDFCETHQRYSEDYRLPRNRLIASRRDALGLSRLELADKLGFYEQAVIEMEEREDFLESWSIELVSKLSGVIGVPLHVLLAIPCPRCGR